MARLLKALVVFLILTGALELVGRIFPPPDPRDPPKAGQEDILLRGNPYLLWELVPGTHTEKGVSVSINTAGFRGPARGAKERPRALSTGDSSVYGFGVPDDAVFTTQLEQRIPADFLNGATPGYSSLQTLNLLDLRALKLEPDLLIVANLWSDNNFDAFVDRDLLSAYADWEQSTAGQLRLLLSNSVLFRWLDWKLRGQAQSEAVLKVGWMAGDKAPRTGKRRVAINDYAANLDAICDRMYARGGGVIFVVLPNREDITRRVDTPAWTPYRLVMMETARRRNAPIVSMPEIFQATGRSADGLFLDQMHPSPYGHQIMADAIATELQRLGWPQQPIKVGPAVARPVYTDSFEGRANESLYVLPGMQ